MNIIIAEMSTKHMSLQMAFTLLNQGATPGNVCLCEFSPVRDISTGRQEGKKMLFWCNPPASPRPAARGSL